MRYKLKVVLPLVVFVAANLGCAQLMPGQSKASVPQPEATIPEPKATIPADVLTRYTVVEGDNFSRISEQNAVYGRAYLWPLIFKANTDKISDPAKLKPGMVLVIPRTMSQAEIDAASSYAKKRQALPPDRVKEFDMEYLQGK